MAEFSNMTHRFDPVKLLAAIASHKGLFYPGIFINWLRYDSQGYPNNGDAEYNVPTFAPLLHSLTSLGSPIRKTDAMGRVHFMPVILKTRSGDIEMPNAVISFNATKTIVETPLPGANGPVIELVTMNGYDIDIVGIVIGADGNYPEAEISALRDIWRLNESVELVCAITDIWIGLGTKIVMKSVDIPEVGAFEDAQTIRFTAKTDSEFDLIIE